MSKPKPLPKAKPSSYSEMADPASLKPHTRNYRVHPDDQLQHIIKSIEEHGFYRNVVIAKDGTILAGHGVVQAARKMGLKQIPIYRLPIDPNSTQAMKVVAGDNEISRLCEMDDRALTEMLKEIKDADSLLGTGFDEAMLAALVMVTRPESEIKDKNEAAEWLGMPEYVDEERPIQLMISFTCEEDREKLMKIINANVINRKAGKIWSIWFPERQIEDIASQRFEERKTND